MITLLAALALTSPIPEDYRLSGPFHPTGAGAEWTYESDWGETTFVVTGVKKGEGGSMLVTVGSRDADRIAPFHTVRVKGRIVEATMDGFDESRAYLSPAREWKTRTVTGVEEVSVPAGKFKCLWVVVEKVNLFGLNRHIEWWAPGVGRVKTLTTDGPGAGSVQVLKKFDAGN